MTSLLLPDSLLVQTNDDVIESENTPDTLISQHTLKELRDMCKKNNKSTAGGKRELAERLCCGPAESSESDAEDASNTITISN